MEMLVFLAVFIVGTFAAFVLVITATMLSSQVSSIEAEYLADHVEDRIEHGSLDYPASETPLSPS